MEILDRIEDISVFPDMYIKIEKFDKAQNVYHKMVIKNYIVLYTINYKDKCVFISHIFYHRRNYLHIL